MPDLTQHYTDQGYRNVLLDPDSGIYAGLMPLMYTTAIVFELHEFGFCERYCFESSDAAAEELRAWHQRGFDDQRPTGWVACRGVAPAIIKQSMQAHHGQDYAQKTLECILKHKLHLSPMEAHRQVAKHRAIPEGQAQHEVAYLRLIGKIL